MTPCWSILLQFGGGVMNGGADAGIGATATQIALHGRVDFSVRRAGDLGQQCGGLHDLAGLTIPALRNLMIDPGLLDRGQRRWCADTFDGGDRAIHV